MIRRVEVEMLRHFSIDYYYFPPSHFGGNTMELTFLAHNDYRVVAVFLHSTLKDLRQDRVNFQEIPPSVGLRFSSHPSRIKDAPFSNSLLATVIYLRPLELGTSSSRKIKYNVDVPCKDTKRDLLKNQLVKN